MLARVRVLKVLKRILELCIKGLPRVLAHCDELPLLILAVVGIALFKELHQGGY